LKNLIIKYYPHNQQHQSPQADEQTRLLYTALHELYHFEKELALHCNIEDHIMLPAISSQSTEELSAVAEKNTTDDLSAREVEVLVHIVKGLSNKEIADTMCLSTHTVMSHRKNIVRKLNIHSIAGLTIYAIVNGIIDLNDEKLI
jgi:regulator of cell morphogenesis and NO signaling